MRSRLTKRVEVVLILIILDLGVENGSPRPVWTPLGRRTFVAIPLLFHITVLCEPTQYWGHIILCYI